MIIRYWKAYIVLQSPYFLSWWSLLSCATPSTLPLSLSLSPTPTHKHTHRCSFLFSNLFTHLIYTMSYSTRKKIPHFLSQLTFLQAHWYHLYLLSSWDWYRSPFENEPDFKDIVSQCGIKIALKASLMYFHLPFFNYFAHIALTSYLFLLEEFVVTKINYFAANKIRISEKRKLCDIIPPSGKHTCAL